MCSVRIEGVDDPSQDVIGLGDLLGRYVLQRNENTAISVDLKSESLRADFYAAWHWPLVSRWG